MGTWTRGPAGSRLLGQLPHMLDGVPNEAVPSVDESNRGRIPAAVIERYDAVLTASGVNAFPHHIPIGGCPMGRRPRGKCLAGGALSSVHDR